jgi:hypothetical protein
LGVLGTGLISAQKKHKTPFGEVKKMGAPRSVRAGWRGSELVQRQKGAAIGGRQC